MNLILKNLLRPALRVGCKCLEFATGFKTDPNGYLPSRVQMLAGFYEADVCKLLASRMPQEGIFVDIGANVGYVSLYILSHCITSKVICVEPNKQLIPVLRQNLARFSQVEIIHSALSDINGESFIYVGMDSAVGSLAEGYARAHHQADRSIQPMSVITITGDDLLSSIPSIDLLKIDIEGHELSALSGMQSLFDKGRIKCVLFELNLLAQRYSSRDPVDLIRFFINNGFEVFEAEGPAKGSSVDADNILRVIERLGPRGYTSLLAELVL